MAEIVFTAPGGPQGENLPVGKQFGNKLFICYPDLRPMYLLNSLTGSQIKCYLSGIKPPVFYPAVSLSSEDAVNITYDADSGSPDANTLFIRYAYYSSVRGIFSEPSPEVRYEIPQTGIKKVIIGGFYYPRDDAQAQDIDTVVVGIQWGVSTDCQCIYGLMSTGFDPNDISSASITFDSTQADLNQLGFGLLQLAEFVKLPPACRSVERIDERLFYIPTRRKVEYNEGAVAVTRGSLTGTVECLEFEAGVFGTGTKFLTEVQPFDPIEVEISEGVTRLAIAQYILSDTFMILTTAFGVAVSGAKAQRMFRGEPAARVILSGVSPATSFNDSLYGMRLTVNGQFLGTVWDVVNGNILYLDGDIPVDIAATTDFFFYAPGDTVLPSGYTNETPFAFPVSFPEGIQYIDAATISQAVDEGQHIQSIQRGGEFAYVLLSDTVLQLTVQSGAFSPLAISYRPVTGDIGPVSARSVCLDQTASVSWIGQEGIGNANTAGASTVSGQINCLRFWHGGRWVDESSLLNCSMAFSRGDYGYVLAGLAVNQATLSGSFLLTQGSGDVVGTGSALLSEAKVGDVFSTPGYLNQHRRILAIADDTHMTIESWEFTGGSVVGTVGQGYWALIALQPQLGIFLFDGLICTTNILSYLDANGQTVLLCGSNYKGRVYRLLSPGTLVDAPIGSSSAPGAYPCEWREGWQSFPGGEQNSLMRVRMMGISAPDPSAALTLSVWTSDLPQRDEADLPAGAFLSKSTTASRVLFDIPLPPNCKRFGSLAVKFLSTAGAVATRCMEVTRWKIFNNGDGK